MPEPSLQCSAILLAAGGSRRMGQPKQLLPVQGKPLVRYLAEKVLQASLESVVVVLGSEAESIRPVLAELPVRVVLNPEWREGLSTSLRAGIEAVATQSSGIGAVIVCLGDQPDLSPAHLERMMARFRTGDCTAVASVAGGVRMPPLLFDRSWFARLCAIRGDLGARALLGEQAEGVATVSMESNQDLDTPDDYARFLH